MRKVYYFVLNLVVMTMTVSSLTENTTLQISESSQLTTLRVQQATMTGSTDIRNESSSPSLPSSSSSSSSSASSSSPTSEVLEVKRTNVPIFNSVPSKESPRLFTNIVTSTLGTIGNETGNSSVAINNAAAPLNIVIIIMIAILAFIIVASVSGGLYVLCWKPTSKGRTPLVESPSEFDVTNLHLYQRNSIMVMFDQAAAGDGNSLNARDAAVLEKVRAAILAAEGGDESRRGSSVSPSKSAYENIGYDVGCNV